MRKSDIDALIRRSRQTLPTIEKEYRANLESKHISEDLKIDIKNVFENLRSCLDYAAHDLNDVLSSGSSKSRKLYFPIKQSRAKFDQTISDFFSGMEEFLPNCHSSIERIQPYNESWLGDFNKLNNNNKHQTLVEQTRTEGSRTTVTRPGSGSVSWTSSVRIGGNVRVMGVPIDPKTQLPVPNSEVETKLERWVDFSFAETGHSVLPFLKESVDKVESIVSDIYDELVS